MTDLSRQIRLERIAYSLKRAQKINNNETECIYAEYISSNRKLKYKKQRLYNFR
jgi:hypothetical protein